MARKKIVVALGGNAILTDDPSAQGQKAALQSTAQQLVALVQRGDDLVITHGNGPQVGNLLLQNLAADSADNPAFELDSLVAMTQGSIGYWLQNAMRNELNQLRLDKVVSTLVTQVLVDRDDPAFQDPSKPIGPYYTEDQAQAKMAQSSAIFKEDAGRGWRKVVASPTPLAINEIETIRKLVDDQHIVIASGGGGIPVVQGHDRTFHGVEAVVDKDEASQSLASALEADLFLVLTGVDHVYINFNEEDQERLDQVSYAELEKHMADGQFAAGSMQPKVQACMDFVKTNPNSQAVITSLDNLENFLNGGSGTLIQYEAKEFLEA